ncbi:MAG: hypothetical protein WBW55_07645 [Desulfobaccales bacterium]
MANSKGRKRPRARKLHRKMAIPTRQSKKWFLTKTVGFLVTMYFLLAAFPTFYSRVWVSPSVSINPNDPFATRFEVSNTGSFAVYNTRLKAKFSGQLGMNTFNNINVEAKPEIIPELEPGQHPVQWIPVIFNMPSRETDKFDLRLEITFKPSFVWWNRTLHQRFVTIRTKDGQFRWTEYPYDSP